MNSRARAVADYQIDSKIFHGRIENFFERGLQPMNFVEEKKIALVERGEHGGEVALFLQQRARTHFDRHAHFICENLRESSFAQTRRAIEQNVIERLFAGTRSLDG